MPKKNKKINKTGLNSSEQTRLQEIVNSSDTNRNAYNSIDLSTIRNVPPYTPPTPTEPPVQIPSQTFVTPQIIPEAIQAPVTPEAESNTVNPFKEQQTTLEDEIRGIEERMAGLSQDKITEQEDSGLFEDQVQLNKKKAKLRELQDKQIEIPLEEKKRYSDANVVATKTDLQKATQQDLENNVLQQLGQSRQIQANAEALNTNLAILDQKYTAKKEMLEFEYKQKNNVLTKVTKAYGDFMTAKQAEALEAKKHQNALDKIDYEHNLKNIHSDATTLLGSGVDGGSVNGFIEGSPDDRDDFAKRAYQSGQLDANQYATIIRNNANDRLSQSKDDATADVLSDTIIKNSEWMIGDITKILNWQDAQGKSKLPQILGRLGQYDWLSTWGEEDKQIVALIDNIFSKETLDAMSKLKGSPSDKDLALVEDAARAGIDRSINDPTHIIEVLTQMKQNLNDAVLKQNAWKIDRNNRRNVKAQSLEEVESILQGGNQSGGVDMNKIIQAESGGSYTALNKSSGAYGKYQFIPSTMKTLAKDLGMTIEQAKTPQGQEAMFEEFTNRNIASLEKADIPINTFTVYGAHQQGSYGFKKILENKITPTIERNMLSNLPQSARKTGDVRYDWINYWSNKMT